MIETVWHANSNSSPPVYPETKGVPLEEMDRVFGEGQYIAFPRRNFFFDQCLQTSAKKRWKMSLRSHLSCPVVRGGAGSLLAHIEWIQPYGAGLG